MLILSLYFLFVVLPLLFWAWFFSWQDSAEPEPKRVLTKLFFWGALAALLDMVLEYALSRAFLQGGMEAFTEQFKRGNVSAISLFAFFVSMAAIEEILKYALLRYAVYYAKTFTQIVDGAVYGVSLALGFAFIENSGYFLSFFLKSYGPWKLLFLAIIRALLPLLLHITTTGIVGLSLGRKKFSAMHSQKVVIGSLLLAIGIHALFNMTLLSTMLKSVFGSIIVLACALTYLLRQIAKPESKMVWKLVAR